MYRQKTATILTVRARFLPLVVKGAVFNIGNELLQMLEVNRCVVNHVMMAAIWSRYQSDMRNHFGHALAAFSGMVSCSPNVNSVGTLIL